MTQIDGLDASKTHGVIAALFRAMATPHFSFEAARLALSIPGYPYDVPGVNTWVAIGRQ